MKAWKEQLAPEGTGVRFMADDKGSFTSSLGLMFDATPVFGAPRSKVCTKLRIYPVRDLFRYLQRYVIIADGDKVEFIFIEEDPTKVRPVHPGIGQPAHLYTEGHYHWS